MSIEKQRAVAFLAPPGAGKGTLSRLCVERLGWRHVSTGDLCRRHIAKGTDVGKQIDFAIKSGKLVSDALVIDMIRFWFAHNPRMNDVVLLDGIPRTVGQAELLYKLFSVDLPFVSLCVVKLLVTDDEIEDRLQARRVCSNKECQAIFSVREATKRVEGDVCPLCGSKLIEREDDDLLVLKNRLRVYRQHECALQSFFERVGQKIEVVDTQYPLEKVYEKFVHLVKECGDINKK